MRMFLPLLLVSAILAWGEDHSTWQAYGGNSDSAQYSSLKQINRENVTELKKVWSYPTGDHNRYSFNPLVVDNTLFALAHGNSIAALNAATGEQLWIHHSDPDTRLITYRGINYWESADRSERRLFYAENNLLHALNAKTGEPIRSFGRDGSVDLREGLGRDPGGIVIVQSNSPGRIFGDLLILGSSTNQEYESAPGDIRAYNVRTGKLVWSFHTVPHPGELGYGTWPEQAWKSVGGANAWSGLSIDEKRGIVYIPTGSPKYNFYGADRKGANLFGDCLLALDARTGKRIWHFQMVHHDIWDYDNPAAPKLLTVRHDGRSVDVVAQVSKQGFVWVFDRVTGKPLWPIEERPVPKSDMPGEEAWPTQPFPTQPPPFARQRFTVDDLSPYIESPEERAKFRDQILSARNEGLFTPPGLRNTVQMPGNNGGANWGGAAVNPASGMLYVVSKDLPAMLKLEPELENRPLAAGTPEQQGRQVYDMNCELCHHADLKGQPPTVPSLVNIGSRMTREGVANLATHGRGLMPGNAELSSTDLNLLLAFLFRPDQSQIPVASGTTGEPSAAKVPTHYRSGFGFMTTKSGLSPIAPPWTSLTAYDLNQGTIKWKRPLGDVPELAARGIHNTGSHFPKTAPVVTAGGLIFTGTRDRKVRAIDTRNGRTLWETEVDAALEGMPAVYEFAGTEYVVFCAAAQSDITAPQSQSSNGAYVAFALPSSVTRKASPKDKAHESLRSP